MLLAIETSSRPGRIALAAKDRIEERRLGPLSPTGERNESSGRAEGQGALVAPVRTDELSLAVAALVGESLPDITAYAISIGPGSFTGLRVGLSFLKGLAFVHRRPVVPVSSLELLALGARGLLPEPRDEVADVTFLLSVRDARRGSVFAALYRVQHGGERCLEADERLLEGRYPLTQVEDTLRALGGLREVLAVGDGAVLLSEGLCRTPSFEHTEGSAAVLASVAHGRLEVCGVDAGTLEPAYHQASGAEEKLGIS